MFFFILYIGIVSSSGIEWKHQRTFALSKLRDFGFGKRSFESSIMEEIKIFLDLLNVTERYTKHQGIKKMLLKDTQNTKG
jgi:hypothetical protein